MSEYILNLLPVTEEEKQEIIGGKEDGTTE